MDKSLQRWRAENPFVLVNVSVVGQMCGRASSVAEARERIEARGDVYVGVDGNRVLFSSPCHC